MKILKEDMNFTPTEEDIQQAINNVAVATNDLQDKFYSLASVLDEAGHKDLADEVETLVINGMLKDNLWEEISDLYKQIAHLNANDTDESLIESTLQEKMWRYKLRAGLTLRDAIEEEDYAAIKEALKKCWEEIHDLIPETFDENDLENRLDELTLLSENDYDYGNPDFSDVDFDDEDEFMEEVADEYDYQLNDLYDFCDEHSIWIPTLEEI